MQLMRYEQARHDHGDLWGVESLIDPEVRAEQESRQEKERAVLQAVSDNWDEIVVTYGDDEE